MATDQEIETVASYLRRTRFQRERPVRRMAREILEAVEKQRAGTATPEVPEEEQRRRERDRQYQRHKARQARWMK
jgi:hypothetical protein